MDVIRLHNIICVCVCAECVLNKMAQAMGSIRVF